MFFRGLKRRGYSQNYLVNLLLRDWKFRVAFCLIGLIIFSLSLLLPKVWKVSPAGYQPISRISGLDYLQAWSLKRRAMHHASEKQFDLAVSSWGACIANRPFDAVSIRESLAIFSQLRNPTLRHVLQVRYYGQMLTALDGHNIGDLNLIAETLLNMGALPEAAAIFSPPSKTKDEESLALKSALYLMDDRSIPFEWLELIKQDVSDRESTLWAVLELYESVRNLNPGGNVPATLLDLQNANRFEDENASNLFLHLGFQLACRANDLETLLEYQKKIESRGLIRSWHLLKKWRLQISVDQKNRAWSEIRHEKALQLLNADQVLELAGIYLDLNKNKACEEMIEKWLSEMPNASSLWVLLGELTIKSGDWDRVRAFAGRIRNEPSMNILEGYSWFLEGEGLRRRGNNNRASAAFSKWENLPIQLPALELRMARHARDEGMNELALRRFRILESHFENHLPYWQELFEFAHDQGQIKYLFQAARKLYELYPRSPRHANNYAAVMLALRENPSEAIGFTLSLVKEFPADLISRINHIHALLQNMRFEDARNLLSNIDRNELPDDFIPAFDLAVFELNFRESNLEKAHEVLETLEIDKLLPPQQVWVRDMVRQIDMHSSSISVD